MRPQRCFDAFRDEYNYERPHEALTYETPASLYQPSCDRIRGGYRISSIRCPCASSVCVISVAGTQWYLSNCLAGELVGLEPIDDASWTVYFGPIQLGLDRARDRKAFVAFLRTGY